jgi:hypothetical protein
MGISCSWHGTELHTTLAGKPEGKGLLLRSRDRWEDIIEMDFKDVGWESVKLICMNYHMDPARFLLNAVHMTVQV